MCLYKNAVSTHTIQLYMGVPKLKHFAHSIEVVFFLIYMVIVQI